MPARKSKKPRILIIEDDASIRTLESTTLKLAGYDVAEAANGEEGLEMVRKRAFDLVLLDIMLPGMDGYEVLRRLRELPKREDTPVIVVTARGREQAGLLQEAAGGADDHIDKPFSSSTLEQAVEAVLSKSIVELEAQRSVQSRAAGVYEAIFQLRASGEGDEDEVRVGRLRRVRR